MKQGKKYALNLLLILVITVGAVWFALKDNYEQVMGLICSIKWYYLIIIMAWGILYTLVIGWIYKMFGSRYRKGYRLFMVLSLLLSVRFFRALPRARPEGSLHRLIS